MNKLSANSTRFHKRVFPIVWFAFLAVFAIVGFTSPIPRNQVWLFVLIPAAMSILGFVLIKRLLADLADEVFDCGDFLLVRNRGEEVRVMLSDIINVNASIAINPPRITLRLVAPTRFGNEISFSPRTRAFFNPFAKNAIAEDLIVRAHAARTKRAREGR